MTPSAPKAVAGAGHGWIVLDKPRGLSSSGAVGAVKRIWRQAGFAKTKVGHGGTLDPLATGVLPVALGEATKLAGRMLASDKVYECTIAFGTATASGDAEGEVVARSDVRPTPAQVEAVLPRFTGEIEQVPPAYSALMVEGRRAYQRARAGEAVEMKPRRVRIARLEILPASGGLDAITLAAAVSKGTYVRSLARDIAEALGTTGHVSMLRRTRAGPFRIDQAITLDKLEEFAKEQRLEAALLPLTAGLDDIPALKVNPEDADRLRRGQRLKGRPEPDGLHVAIQGDVPVALVAVTASEVRVERGFNL